MNLLARLRRSPTLISLLSLWTWAEIGVVCVVGCLLHMLLVGFTWPFDRRRLLSGRFYRGIAVCALRLSPMWSAQVVGTLPRRRPGRTVVVSNHVSHLDSFLIASLPWEMKWLGKRSLFNIPLVGWGMALAGDIPVVRGSAASRAEAMRRCGAYLQQEVPICIFPEGTRSRTRELLPFRDGAFRLAIEHGADVLPLAVAGTQRGLPKHSWRFGFSRGVLKVGTPISTRGMGISEVGALRDQVRAQIEAMVAEIEPLTAL